MSAHDPEISLVYSLIVDLGVKDDVAPMPLKVSGCWERIVDDNWTVVLNGHRTPQRHNGTMVQPYHCHVYWNGWPAGILTPFDGVLAAHPDQAGANEEHLIRALQAALA